MKNIKAAKAATSGARGAKTNATVAMNKKLELGR
jgi:hypothetical protein